MYKKYQQQLVAHRGYSTSYPENTLIAMRKALASGALYLETDVHLSADQVPLLLHDAILSRICGENVNVMQLNYAELQNFSAYYPQRFGQQFKGEAIATLEQLVGLIKDAPLVTVFVEAKRASIEQFGIDSVYEKISQALAAIQNQCVLISFDDTFIKTVLHKQRYKAGWVIDEHHVDIQNKATNLQPHYLFSDLEVLDDEIKWKWLQQGNWRWAVYETDEESEVEKWLHRGVDLVETNAIGDLLASKD